jgi:hypothetical protein
MVSVKLKSSDEPDGAPETTSQLHLCGVVCVCGVCVCVCGVCGACGVWCGVWCGACGVAV